MKYLNQNPLDKLHPGEPYFFVRAQDIHALETVRGYAASLHDAGDYAGCNEVHKIADAMMDWQKANPDKVKHPD